MKKVVLADLIPDEVKEEIFDHIERSISNSAPFAYRAAAADEDVLTGEFGAALRTKKTKKVMDDATSALWDISIDYKKARGRGAGALEKVIGADGILQIIVQTPDFTVQKSALFQAKRDWVGADSVLLEQCKKMNNWPHSSFVLNYKADQTEIYNTDDIVRNSGKNNALIRPISVAQFVMDEFIACRVGDLDLEYDVVEGHLLWVDESQNLCSLKAPIKGVTQVKVSTPERVPRMGKLPLYPVGPEKKRKAKKVPKNDIQNHKMAVRQTAEMISQWGVPGKITLRKKSSQNENEEKLYNPENISSDNGLKQEIRIQM